MAAGKMERSGRDRSKKVAAVEAGLKQAAENKKRKIGNQKKQKKMKTVALVPAEFPSAPVTAVLDQTTVVTPMVKTLLNYSTGIPRFPRFRFPQFSFNAV